MALSTPEEKEKQKKIEVEFGQLALEYERKVKQIDEQTYQLTQSNELLQAEILERKKMELEILEIAQAEQKRFGAQLHDGLCQELTAILVFTKSLFQKMEKDKTLELNELTKISDMLLNAVDEARATARGLYPGELAGDSLMHSLEELVFQTSQTQKVECSFYCPEVILINNTNTATHLYRIAQEGISNAVKHGKAQKIEVSFIKNAENVIFSIKDDGIGIKGDYINQKGIGLKIMKYRTHMMNASFQIKPNSPQGVLLECILKNPDI